jgi:dicarboxylate/amino acid:cation (Na+ or H+) symporter, DAACS family
MASSNTPLANRILKGLVIGIIAGVATLGLARIMPSFTLPWQDAPKAFIDHVRTFATYWLDPFGKVFLRMLFFVIVPLIFASLASGVVQLGRLDKLGPLAGRTFWMFFLNMGIGATLGLLMMNFVEPGSHLNPETKDRLMKEFGGAAQSTIERRENMPAMSPNTIVEMFMPANLFGAFVGNNRNALGDVLPLIAFAILVGAVGTQLSEDKRQKLQDGLDMVNDLMTRIVHFALMIAPYAVPAMIYSVIVKIGVDILIALGLFVVSCIAILLVHLFGTMSIFIKLWTDFKPSQFFKDIREPLVTAFSTSSSAATLPTALSCAREKLDCSPSTSGFVLPLGTTMNMSGTALYEGCVVLFVAQVFGIELSLSQQVTLVLLTVLSAVAVAGIPGGSIPLIAGLLITFGIPPEGIGIVLGIDRLLDMSRTATNVGCDMVTVAVVDRQVKRADAARAARGA